jgi:hypothetical protein
MLCLGDEEIDLDDTFSNHYDYEPEVEHLFLFHPPESVHIRVCLVYDSNADRVIALAEDPWDLVYHRFHQYQARDNPHDITARDVSVCSHTVLSFSGTFTEGLASEAGDPRLRKTLEPNDDSDVTALFKSYMGGRKTAKLLLSLTGFLRCDLALAALSRLISHDQLSFNDLSRLSPSPLGRRRDR